MNNAAGKGITAAASALFLTLSCLSGPALAAAAGRVVFATGAPQAVDSAGAVRNLKRGDDVFAGDRLVTDARSRVQVGFADGAYISLQPNSEYHIEVYNYNGQPDGTEQASYRLLKGGVRAVTGMIGKRDPETYKVHTAVATIGIRGTGHNTRFCQGDCGNRKNGLYHNTWEGTTYVRNDVDSRDVPTGQGVYVEALDKPIVKLDQPSAATAVDTGQEIEDEQEAEEERVTTFAAGDQRNEEGTQVIVFPDEEEIPGGGTSTALTGQMLVSTPGSTVFVNQDGKPVGGILEFTFTDGVNDYLMRQLITIDIDSVKDVSDPEAAAKIAAMLANTDSAVLDGWRSNPGKLVEIGSAGEVTFGRWGEGNVLLISDISGDVYAEFFTLEGYESLHFIYGPEPGVLPMSGIATYNFVGGTESTSFSGSAIGQGVLAGHIDVDFGTSTAQIEMDVRHDSIDYLVQGPMELDRGLGAIYEVGTHATTTASGSACNPSCDAWIEGGFIGPSSGGIPMHLGISYEIQESDPIEGVAAFSR